MTDLDNTGCVRVTIDHIIIENTLLYFVTPFTTFSVVLCHVRAISIFFIEYSTMK